MQTQSDYSLLPSCPAELNTARIAQYREQGYLAFRDVLTQEEVRQAKLALNDLLHDVLQNNQPVNNELLRGSPVTRFHIQYEPGYQPLATATAAELELKVRKLMWFSGLNPFMTYLGSQQPHIQVLLQQLLGDTPLMFQDMALVKPPFIGSEKPWHQDNAYFSVLPLNATIGVWIALDEATTENGCMYVLPGGHKLGALRHFHGRDCEIVEGRIPLEQAVPIELPPGGAMFFSGMLPHQTPPNSSPHRRRAVQYHYRATGSRIVTADEYNSVYNDNGQPASCAANK